MLEETAPEETALEETALEETALEPSAPLELWTILEVKELDATELDNPELLEISIPLDELDVLEVAPLEGTDRETLSDSVEEVETEEAVDDSIALEASETLEVSSELEDVAEDPGELEISMVPVAELENSALLDVPTRKEDPLPLKDVLEEDSVPLDGISTLEAPLEMPAEVEEVPDSTEVEEVPDSTELSVALEDSEDSEAEVREYNAELYPVDGWLKLAVDEPEAELEVSPSETLS